MLDEKYIMKRVREWAKTPYGKKKIKETCGIDYRDSISIEELISYGNQMKQILFNHISHNHTLLKSNR